MKCVLKVSVSKVLTEDLAVASKLIGKVICLREALVLSLDKINVKVIVRKIEALVSGHSALRDLLMLVKGPSMDSVVLSHRLVKTSVEVNLMFVDLKALEVLDVTKEHRSRAGLLLVTQ